MFGDGNSNDTTSTQGITAKWVLWGGCHLIRGVGVGVCSDTVSYLKLLSNLTQSLSLMTTLEVSRTSAVRQMGKG